MSNDTEPRPPQPPDAPSDRASRSAGDAPPADPADDGPVPRLPRGRGIRLSLPEILRILMIAAMLIAVLVLRKPCAESTGRFIESFEPPVDAGPTRTPGQLPPGRYIPLTGEMTEQELRDKLELLDQSDAGPASGAAADPAHPSEDTAHDRDPRNPAEPRPARSSPSGAAPAPR